MTVFLVGFSVFNLLLGLVAVRRALRLMTPAGRDWWASQRLYAIAMFAAWTLPAVCVIATGLAWGYAPAARHWAAPTILAPTAWLLVMGVFFAIVDFAEDGVFDFGRGPKAR